VYRISHGRTDGIRPIQRLSLEALVATEFHEIVSGRQPRQDLDVAVCVRTFH